RVARRLARVEELDLQLLAGVDLLDLGEVEGLVAGVEVRVGGHPAAAVDASVPAAASDPDGEEVLRTGIQVVGIVAGVDVEPIDAGRKGVCQLDPLVVPGAGR